VYQQLGKRIVQVFTGDADAERARRAARNRQAMIQKVRSFWIKGVLEQSLYQVARIELGLAEQSDAVERPWDMIVQQPEREPRHLAPGGQMVEVFDELGGAFLILGQPGAGKTTLLIELARDLLDRAEQDPHHLLPVMFNLFSWAARRNPLAEWLVDELNERYHVPRTVAQAWVDEDQLLLLLDGLDEVAQEHRETCVAAINTYRQEHGLMPLVVSSRVADYESLGTRLHLSGALVVQPLTRGQVDGYLVHVGEPLAGMREALQSDVTLYELFDTPLNLSIAAMAYRGMSATAIQATGIAKAWRECLFSAYIDAMFRRRSRESRYTRVQTERWLSWLARQMVDHDQSAFFVEQMQPDWLSMRTQWRLVAWGLAIVFGLLFGASGGLAIGLISRLAYGPGIGLALGSLAGLVFGLDGGLDVGVSIHDKHIRPAERLHWSWSAVRANSTTILVFGLVVGVIIGAAFGLVGGLSLGLGFGLVFGLVGGLSSVLVSGLVGGLVFGLIASEMDTRTRPNEGMLHSAQSGLVVGLVVGLGVGLVGGAIGGTAGSTAGGTIGGLVLALIFGLGSGPIFGLVGFLEIGGRACFQHLVLRLLLWRNGFAPLGYVRFLDYAAERIFLRKVGGGYIFVHRLLMEHFAAKWESKEEVTVAKNYATLNESQEKTWRD
jgi:DNA polymerase III delta prime subunit